MNINKISDYQKLKSQQGQTNEDKYSKIKFNPSLVHRENKWNYDLTLKALDTISQRARIIVQVL